MKLLVIPARGGSKRIPRKNIKEFAGRPMIAWPIEAAKQSGVFDQIVVSTEDAQIAEVAREWGAEVPFLRRSELADDHAGTRAVMADAIARLAVKEGVTCCLYATAPFVTAADLRSATATITEEPDVQSVISVVRVDSSLLRSFTLDSGRLKRLLPSFAATRSQDLPPVYRDAGQFYVASNERWLGAQTPLAERALPYVLRDDLTVDIDTPEDWLRAEDLFLAWTNGGTRPRSAGTPSGQAGEDA